MNKIDKIKKEHFHDVTISILEKYNMNNDFHPSSSLEGLTDCYIKDYIEVYNALVEKFSKE